jgi:hypothetical protein
MKLKITVEIVEPETNYSVREIYRHVFEQEEVNVDKIIRAVNDIE